MDLPSTSNIACFDGTEQMSLVMSFPHPLCPPTRVRRKRWRRSNKRTVDVPVSTYLTLNLNERMIGAAVEVPVTVASSPAIVDPLSLLLMWSPLTALLLLSWLIRCLHWIARILPPIPDEDSGNIPVSCSPSCPLDQRKSMREHRSPQRFREIITELDGVYASISPSPDLWDQWDNPPPLAPESE